MKSKTTHVDEYIDDYRGNKYARWFLFLKRLPVGLQSDFNIWIKDFRLFADYGGKRVRVTGASRLGDVWITSNHAQDCGYERRVDVSELSRFGGRP